MFSSYFQQNVSIFNKIAKFEFVTMATAANLVTTLTMQINYLVMH